MPGFTKLHSTIINSSVWDESDSVRIVWVTLLAMADAGGFVESSLPGLAHQSRKTIPETEAALLVLERPDPHSKNPDHDGRRISKVEAGWLVLNYVLYRAVQEVSDEPSDVANRARVNRHRARKRLERESLQGITKPLQGITPASASASVSNRGSVEGGNGDWKPNQEQSRLNRLFKRRETTKWSPGEVKAWRILTPIPEEDLATVERFYEQTERIENKGYRRHDLLTLLNNFNGEVDRARNFRPPKPF